MNKTDLIEALSEELNLPVREVKGIVNTILNTMTEALVNGRHIEIRGFGSFSVKQYDSYTGMKPRTGEKIKVKAKKLPVFRVGKDLREAVDGGRD
jgi:integration host factor subunit beta